MTKTSAMEELSGSAYWRHAAAQTRASWKDAFKARSMLSNVSAGVTVALVALPLNVALAIACGLPASVGLVTGAIAGLLGAALGGSRLQVTGPEVALAPITFEIVVRHGFEGLIVAVACAGLIQIAFGLMRVGRMIHLIPVPVIAGFLAAVALLVFDTQIPVLLGVSGEARQVSAISVDVLRRIPWGAVATGAVVMLAMVAIPKLSKRIPAPLVGLVLAMALGFSLDLDIPAVDPMERGWPAPALPPFGGVDLLVLLPEAVALALLASIDSLLCAVSIDARVPGSRTRTDQELVAQGLANLGSACFGGMPVAAAIVRSAAAVEAGATTRLAPAVQSIVLGLVTLALAPLLRHVPLSALAAVLLVVAWRLIDFRQLVKMWKMARIELVVFGATAAGILLTDFVMGVIIGVVVALADFARRQRVLLTATSMRTNPVRDDVRVLRVEGPLFFASQAKVDRLLGEVHPRGQLVLDFDAVPTIDTSGLLALLRGLERFVREGNRVWLCSLSEEWKELIHGFADFPVDRIHLASDVESALRDMTYPEALTEVA